MREGRETVFRYAGTETGYAHAGRRYCGGGGRDRQKTSTGEEVHQTAGGEDGAGQIGKLRNNTRRSLGL